MTETEDKKMLVNQASVSSPFQRSGVGTDAQYIYKRLYWKKNIKFHRKKNSPKRPILGHFVLKDMRS